MVHSMEGTTLILYEFLLSPTQLTHLKDIIRSNSRISRRIDVDKALDFVTIYAIVPRKNYTQNNHRHADLCCSIW
jgi:hypothetical protein